MPQYKQHRPTSEQIADSAEPYGRAPVPITWPLDLSDQWHEFMHYLYLPVRIPLSDNGVRGIGEYGPLNHEGSAVFALPKRLEFLRESIKVAMADAAKHTEHLDDPYVYVTARRGFATPGNPLNRPGFHTDDFGGTDLNYIWTDAYPTRFLTSNLPLDIDDDDEVSMRQMTHYANKIGTQGGFYIDGQERHTDLGLRLVDGPVNTLLRLDPYVIHTTPEIPEPGGMRSFFKISVSTHRYDLVGNSHNYDLDYDWPMVSREQMRNQPNGNKDYSGGSTR